MVTGTTHKKYEDQTIKINYYEAYYTHAFTAVSQ